MQGMALTKSTTNNQLTNNNMGGMPLTPKTTTASCIIERHAINKRQSHLGVSAIIPRPKGSLTAQHTAENRDTQQDTDAHSKTQTHTQHSTQTYIDNVKAQQNSHTRLINTANSGQSLECTSHSPQWSSPKAPQAKFFWTGKPVSHFRSLIQSY